MAGPCCTILLPTPVSPSGELQIRAVVDAVASSVEGNDFWIAGMPFSMGFGEPDEDERSLSLDGWRPEGAVTFCAMCDGRSDHVLLAMLCGRSAEILGGRIALGDLSLLTDDASVLTFDRQRPIAGHGYVVSPKFLGHWMSHPDFCLVK
jgi:hypothetical protein